MSLADLQLLNPQLFQPLREPTVNISHAILCSFFPPPLAPCIALQPTHRHFLVTNRCPKYRRMPAPLPPVSFFHFRESNPVWVLPAATPPLQPSALVPTAAAVPAPLSLSASSRLYCAGGGESFDFWARWPSHPPCLPHWASMAVEGGRGVRV